jgi:hypothetical protein
LLLGECGSRRDQQKEKYSQGVIDFCPCLIIAMLLLNPAKQSKQAKQASKQANQQIGLG